MKSFEVVKDVLNDALEEFGDEWEINETALNKLESDCKIIDILADENDSDEMEVEVDEKTKQLRVTIIGFDIIVKSKDHLFYRSIQDAAYFGFRNINDNVSADFVFTGIIKK